MAQLAPQLRRQLWRRLRPAALERPRPLPEHHRHPRWRPRGCEQHLQLRLQYPAAQHAGPRQRRGPCTDGHGQPDPRRHPDVAGGGVPDLLRRRVHHASPLHPCARPGRQHLYGEQRHQLSGSDAPDGLRHEPPAEERPVLQRRYGQRPLPQLQRYGGLR